MKPHEPAIRPSALAGAWYPASAPALRVMVTSLLDQAGVPPLPGAVVALVSPHAGYVYSGTTAAHAFAQVRGCPYKRVVLLGPLHRPIRGSRLGAFMAPAESAYATPLGDVPIDRAFIDALDRRVPLTPVSHDEEHALEIELPFLQVALGEFSLVPLMLGEHIADPGVPERLDALAAALSELSDEETLLVASTDLSHLEDYDAVVRTDRRLVELLNAFDLPGLTQALRRGEAQACGATGLVATLKAARNLGAHGVQVLAQTNSGDVTGKRRQGGYTVGYVAAAAYR